MLKNVLKKFNRQPTLLGRCGRKNVLFKKETFCFCIVVSAVLVSSADSAISPSLCPCITSTDELALDTLLPRYGPLYGADIIGNTTGRPYGIGCYAHVNIPALHTFIFNEWTAVIFATKPHA